MTPPSPNHTVESSPSAISGTEGVTFCTRGSGRGVVSEAEPWMDSWLTGASLRSPPTTLTR